VTAVGLAHGEEVSMKRTMIVVLTVAVAITMTACDALDSMLNYNLFASLAAVSPKEIAKADAATLVKLSASDSFYSTLATDPTLKESSLKKIEEAMSADPPSSSNYQELAVLAANIHLQTTAAGDFINNVSGLMVDLIDESAPDFSDLERIIGGLVPGSIKSSDGSINKASFLAMITALEEADNAYRDLGLAIGSGAYASGADIVPGEVAQNALIAAIVATVVPPSGTRGEYLYALLTNPATPDPDSTVFPSFPDMETGYLGNILSAANISF
jgi:hypothetical protein